MYHVSAQGVDEHMINVHYYYYYYYPVTNHLQHHAFGWKSFHMLMQNRERKCLRISNFTLLSVIFEITSWQLKGYVSIAVHNLYFKMGVSCAGHKKAGRVRGDGVLKRRHSVAQRCFRKRTGRW